MESMLAFGNPIGGVGGIGAISQRRLFSPFHSGDSRIIFQRKLRRQSSFWTKNDVQQRRWNIVFATNEPMKRGWDFQRSGALVLGVLVAGAAFRGTYMLINAPKAMEPLSKEACDAYLESVIPEPTPANIRRVLKQMWQRNMPKGYRVKKYVRGPTGEYLYDPTYVGDHDWNENIEIGGTSKDVMQLIDENDKFTAEEKEQYKSLITKIRSKKPVWKRGDIDGLRSEVDMVEFINASDLTPEEKERWLKAIGRAKSVSEGKQDQSNMPEETPLNVTWKERFAAWEDVLERVSVRDKLERLNSRFQIEFDWDKVRDNFERDKLKRTKNNQRAFWVARRWWKYRPKLPYTYFLAKVESLEVEAAVYSEDMTKLFITMKDAFPSEFVVDIPVDPYLYDKLKAHGVELDGLHRSDFSYLLRGFVALFPSLLLISYIRSVQYRARVRATEKIYDLLKMNRSHLILPEDAASKAKSQYKDVVVGGDVWQVLEEIMVYMRNPMKYHDQKVKLPRGILISGPPGTGKTLLARAIARECGLPFVFASGAEFVESSTGNGSDKIFDIFFTARANAPSFVFIDEIDALAGKNVNDDAERRATFEQLLSELDGEPEDTDVFRFSLRQAVILICATNRPDELDEQFVRPGRIDREIHIGLPGEKERISIFGVHSEGKPLAKDVNFSKLAFRTIGYSGADLRNLINESGIMAVRKGHEEITQQDLIDVLDKQLFEGMGMVLMDEEQERVEQKVPQETKKLLAVHEAGHILLAHLMADFDWHAFSHLLPGGSETALSVFFPRQELLELGFTTIGYLRMQMVVAHGGRCAEKIVYGDNISDGGQDDLAKLSAIARELTISPTNSRLGLLPIKWRDTIDPPNLPGEVDLIPNEWSRPGTQIANMSIEVSELFTREVTRFIDETEEVAMEALSNNQHILDSLTERLMLKTKISGLEAEDIVKSMNPVTIPDFLGMDENLSLADFMNKAVPGNIEGRYKDLDVYPAPLHRC